MFWLICLCTQVRRCVNGSYATELAVLREKEL